MNLTMIRVLLIALLVCTRGAGAQQVESTESANCDEQGQEQEQDSCPSGVARAISAVKAYATAPLRWDSRDWLYFGGAVAAVGAAHALDSKVRTHFVGDSLAGAGGSSGHTLGDAVPAATLLLGTWGYANLIGDSDGRHEAGAMFEATALSIGMAYVLNYASGRRGPDQTTNSNRWFSGGTSFPSEHTTAAFAIGTVLAESGNGRYRWIRRVIGYGAAGFTAYERLKHNAHWLSDTASGAALGAASARFAMDREPGRSGQPPATLMLKPLPQGVMLAYTLRLPWDSD